jgi:hypothetical protein
MRDGWLYVIDAKKRELSEYRVLDGVVTAMLWQGTDVHSDRRETPINKPVLIYPARAELHVCHSKYSGPRKSAARSSTAHPNATTSCRPSIWARPIVKRAAPVY